MVGKRQRNQPASGKTAIDATKKQSVRESLRGIRRREGDGLVAIGTAQCLEPAGSVKYRSVGMTLQELRPSRILEGINPMNYGHNFPRRES